MEKREIILKLLRHYLSNYSVSQCKGKRLLISRLKDGESLINHLNIRCTLPFHLHLMINIKGILKENANLPIPEDFCDDEDIDYRVKNEREFHKIFPRRNLLKTIYDYDEEFRLVDIPVKKYIEVRGSEGIEVLIGRKTEETYVFLEYFNGINWGNSLFERDTRVCSLCGDRATRGHWKDKTFYCSESCCNGTPKKWGKKYHIEVLVAEGEAIEIDRPDTPTRGDITTFNSREDLYKYCDLLESRGYVIAISDNEVYREWCNSH